MKFSDLGIIEPILKALEQEGYTNPTPIQEQSIPTLLERNDLLACAQTGTGKTAAFAVPIIQHIHKDSVSGNGQRRIVSLIVTPTRELAIQIGESIDTYGKYTNVRSTVIFGGVKQGKQTEALKKGIDILVATPGRLLDLIHQGFITLDHIKYFVLDEADHMLDMGFIHDIRKIVALLPQQRQSLFFSATMPPEIINLSGKILGNPQRVSVKPQQATAEKVQQALYHVAKKDKLALLIHLIKEKRPSSTLVFSRTKYGADKIVRKLIKAGIKAAGIHGNKSQVARQRALGHFKDGSIRVLIATDIAARGIDVDDLALVINFDLPSVPETYVHRIGRTGRAEASGIAISFCHFEEDKYLRGIQRLIKQDIPVVSDHPFPEELTDEQRTQSSSKSKPKPKANTKSKNRRWRNSRGSKNANFKGNNRPGQRRTNSVKKG